jgi:hypothetical protein
VQYIPLALGGLSAATSVIGGFSRREQAKTEADTITAEYEEKERAYRRQATQILAKQQAIGAASGVDIATGSPLELALNTAFEAERNALNIRQTGRYKRQAKLYEADLYAFEGVSSGLGMGASLLGSWYSGGAQTYSPGQYQYPNSPFGQRKNNSRFSWPYGP